MKLAFQEHSHKWTALLMTTFTKSRFSQLPHKLCSFTFPKAAGCSFGHLFCVPRVSSYKSFHFNYYYFYFIFFTTTMYSLHYNLPFFSEPLKLLTLVQVHL